MASYNYEGNTYFFTFGKWVDSDNRPVKPDISAMLSKLFPEEEIRKKEKEQRAKKSIPKKQKKKSGSTYVISKPAKVFADNNIRSLHRKATEIPYYRRFELTDDQKKALALLESGNNVFLTGEAGTGKSFVLNEFLHRNRKRNIIVCAPTGIAAINVGGSTIHRVFKAPIGVTKPGEYNSNPSDAVIKADIIVIDEISMCRFDLFEYVIRTIRYADEIRQNKANMEALSNGQLPEQIKQKQIIVVGDFYQLAPVISNKDKDVLFSYWDKTSIGEGFAFMSPLWKELDFKNIVIKEIVRQAGENEYVKNLNKIRIGDQSGIDWFNSNITREPIQNGIYLCGTNQKADEINKKESEALSGKSINYTAQINGSVGEGDKMTSDELSLKVGMQVMTLINDSSEGFQNGSIGKIVALGSDHVDVKLDNGRVVTVTAHDWEILGYEVQEDKLEKVVLGNFKQLPLKIAYAITIHKSQGQTYSSVNISPVCFAAGQLYVALSRAKTSDGMSLEHTISRGALRTSTAVKQFYEELTENYEHFTLKKLEDIKENPEGTEEPGLNNGSIEEFPWDDEDTLDSGPAKTRSSVYEKVMNMTDEEASSCTMYQSIKNNHSAYASWTENEDIQLIEELRQGISEKEIAKIHERTLGAIRSRIRKLKPNT